MVASPIVGPAYRSRSPSLADQRCINLYLETVETKTGKEPFALYSCPGLDYEATIGIGPIRGLHAVGTTLYVASGSFIYQVTPGFSATQIGEMATTSGKVSIIDNGAQVAFSDRAFLYAWSGGMFSVVDTPSVGPPGDLVYQDTLGVYNEIGTFNLWQSNPNDLTTWDPLNFDTADGSAQPIIALIDLHRQIVPLKADSSEFWINVGNQGFVFQRLDGVFPQIGAVNAASLVSCGEEICWLGSDDGGNGVIYAMGGYEPRRVSTFAQEWAISQYATINDCVAFSYLQAGHRFAVFSFPTARETWTLDLTESAALGFPCWHQRASFSNGQFGVYEPVCSELFNGQVIVGSGAGGNLYRLDLSNQSDGQTLTPTAIGTPYAVAQAATTGSVTSFPATTTASVNAGDMIYVAVWSVDQGNVATGVTDTVGNTYTLFDQATAGGSLGKVTIWTCNPAKALPSGDTVTAHFGGTNDALVMIVAGCPGVVYSQDSAVAGGAAFADQTSVSDTFTISDPSSQGFLLTFASSGGNPTPTITPPGWTFLTVAGVYVVNMNLFTQAFAGAASLTSSFNFLQECSGGVMLDTFAGQPPSPPKVRKWLRSWRAHPGPQIKSQRYNVLEIDHESGVTPPGQSSTWMLRYCDDAHTWSSERFVDSGDTGEYAQRMRFRRLGMERRGLSSDRVFELSGTASATSSTKVAILGADFE